MKKSGLLTRDDLAAALTDVALKIANGELEDHNVADALRALSEALLHGDDAS